MLHVGDWIAHVDSFNGAGIPKNPGLVTGVKYDPNVRAHTLSVFWFESRYAATVTVVVSPTQPDYMLDKIVALYGGDEFMHVPVSIVRHKV